MFVLKVIGKSGVGCKKLKFVWRAYWAFIYICIVVERWLYIVYLCYCVSVGEEVVLNESWFVFLKSHWAIFYWTGYCWYSGVGGLIGV